MPDPLEQAQTLFEAGSTDEAADVLRQVGEVARARGRVDVLAEIDDLVDQMRTRLNGPEREEFDRVLHEGQPAGATLRPLATALLNPAVLVLALVAALTLVVAWATASSESCSTQFPSSGILLIASTVSAAGAGVALGLRSRGGAFRSILFGAVDCVAIGGVWLLVGGYVWAVISFGNCPFLEIEF